MTRAESAIEWRALLPSAFLPNCLYQLGQGAIIPVIPVFAHELGADLGFSALVLSMLAVGQLVGTLPAGKLVGAVGERNGMLAGSGVCIAGGLLCVLATDKAMLAVGVLLIGLAAAVFGLARHTYLTLTVALSHRARVLSIAAGFARFGLLVGPFCSVAVLHTTGEARAVFAIVIATSSLLAVLVMFGDDPPKPDDDVHPETPDSFEAAAAGLWSTARAHRRILTTLGVAAALLGMVRQGRLVVVPLWGTALGMSGAQIAWIMGLSSVLDVMLFYTGGQIMDRFGRLWVALPTLLVFATTYAWLTGLDVLPAPEVWLVASAAAMSAMNGVSSGINATMGSDLSPAGNPATFLSVWRATADVGPALAPLVIAAVTGAVSLSAACAAMAGFSLLGVGVITRFAALLPWAGRRAIRASVSSPGDSQANGEALG